MYVLLPMPLLFFAGSDGSVLFSESNNRFVLFYLKLSISSSKLFFSVKVDQNIVFLLTS